MSRPPTDWAVWLPKAFFLDWSDRKKWERHLSDPTIWLPLGIFPQEIREGIVNYYFRTQGDTISVGTVQGEGITIGKDIESKVYSKALDDISHTINERLKDNKISQEQANLIKNSLEELKNKMKT